MSEAQEYVLGDSARAARRLEVQDHHFAEVSERLLDDLALRPTDRVVELGCGAGSFSRRVLRRLGAGGVLVAVDASAGLLQQAQAALANAGPARFVPVQADIAELGPWLDGADAVVARTMLHHVPMVEFVLGRLRARVRPGTRVGLLEPDFRAPLGRLAFLEATGRSELAPLAVWRGRSTSYTWRAASPPRSAPRWPARSNWPATSTCARPGRNAPPTRRRWRTC